VDVLVPADDGRPGQVRMVADLYGKEYDATLEVLHNRAAQELRFCLIEAANLASLEGSFH
jgi:hypothetical protein